MSAGILRKMGQRGAVFGVIFSVVLLQVHCSEDGSGLFDITIVVVYGAWKNR